MALLPNVRFARAFQVDPLHPGTAAQRQALYDRLSPNFGSKADYLNWRLARAIKKVRPYIPLGFYPNMTNPSLSSPAGINFSSALDVSGTKQYAGHEYGWIVNHYLLTDADKQWFMAKVGATDFGIPVQEQFAMAVNEWLDGGWVDLDPILLRVDPIVVPPTPPAPPAPVPPLTFISPSFWGAAVDYDSKHWTPWNPDKIVVHYEGGSGLGNGTVAQETARLRAHEKFHIEVKGWLGLAYNAAIGNSGTIYRVRGENRSGATSGDAEPDGIPENYEAYAVLFLVGGDQEPSLAALNTFKKLWVLRGKPPVTVHKDSTSTSCPGWFLTTWVRAKGYIT